MKEHSPELAERVRAFEKQCRHAGFPLTLQRRAILEAMLSRDDHPTADQVHEALVGHAKGISRATVYRTLNSLVELGAIGRAHQLGAATRFDANAGHHHHLVCVQCNRVTDYMDARLDDLPLPDISGSGFRTTDYSIHFTGLCPDCQAGREPATP